MNKQEFFEKLRKGLSGLPQKETEERITFYSEMIDDRIEDGLSEEEAVRAAGSVDEVVLQIVSDIPFSKIAKDRIRPKRQLKIWEIILLLLGSPLWFPILISLIFAVFSLYVSLWAVIISLWVVFIAFVCFAFCGIVGGIVLIIGGDVLTGIITVVAGVVCAGLSILMFFGCKAVTKGFLVLTKKIAIWIKNCFIKKEEA